MEVRHSGTYLHYVPAVKTEGQRFLGQPVLHESLSQNKAAELGMVTHACNPSTQAAGGLCKSEASLSYRVRACLQKKKKKNFFN